MLFLMGYGMLHTVRSTPYTKVNKDKIFFLVFTENQQIYSMPNIELWRKQRQGKGERAQGEHRFYGEKFNI